MTALRSCWRCWNQPMGVMLCENEKKRSEATQTLRAGCRKAEPKIFAPPQTPFPEAQDGQNLISWRWSLPSPIDPVWRGSMHAISSYRGNRLTNKQTHKHTNKRTHRQDRLQYTAPLSLARCNNLRSIASVQMSQSVVLSHQWTRVGLWIRNEHFAFTAETESFW